MHTCMHTWHVYIHACMYTYYMHTCMHACMHTCHVYIHACMYTYYMHVCMHAYMHVYTLDACVHLFPRHFEIVLNFQDIVGIRLHINSIKTDPNLIVGASGREHSLRHEGFGVVSLVFQLQQIVKISMEGGSKKKSKKLGGWAGGPQVYKNIYPSLSSSDPAYAVRDRTYSFTCGV